MEDINVLLLTSDHRYSENVKKAFGSRIKGVTLFSEDRYERFEEAMKENGCTIALIGEEFIGKVRALPAHTAAAVITESSVGLNIPGVPSYCKYESVYGIYNIIKEIHSRPEGHGGELTLPEKPASEPENAGGLSLDESGRPVYALPENDTPDMFALGMLMNNNIDGLLGCTLETTAKGRSIRYVKPEGEPLPAVMKKVVNKHLFISVLKAVAEAKLHIDEYMLDENGLITNIDHIYADENGKVSMIYIPARHHVDSISLPVMIKKWIMSGLFDEGEDLSYVVRINNKLNSVPDISTAELCTLFDSLDQTAGMISKINMLSAAAGEESIPSDGPTPDTPIPKLDLSQSDEAETPQPVFEFTNPFSEMADYESVFEKTKWEDEVGGQGADSGIPDDSGEESRDPFSEFTHGGDYGESAGAGMLPYLESIDGERFYIDKDNYKIGKGRHPSLDIDLIIDNEHVGRFHASIVTENGGRYLIDNGSVNGSYINGKKILSGVKTALNDGDVLTLANEKLTYRE